MNVFGYFFIVLSIACFLMSYIFGLKNNYLMFVSLAGGIFNFIWFIISILDKDSHKTIDKKWNELD